MRVWETAFIAASLALGESEQDTLASLDAAPARELLATLKSPDKRVRAKALATAIAAIALDLEQTEITW